MTARVRRYRLRTSMAVTLTIAGSPPLSAHEAHALSMLLEAIGSEPAVHLAARLDPNRSRSASLALTPAERQTLFDALCELRPDRIPRHVLELRHLLAVDLSRSTP